MRSNAVTGQRDRQDKKVDRSIPQSVPTLSVDRSLFRALVTKLNYFTANALFLEVHLTQWKIYILSMKIYIIINGNIVIIEDP